MASPQRPLFSSHQEFIKAKRRHLTDCAAAVIPPPPGSPLRMRQHPCQRPADGPEFREWKYSSTKFVDPHDKVPEGGLHSSQRTLALVKCQHTLSMQSGACTPSPQRDPMRFRHVSQHELAHEVRNNKTPLYPVRAAETSQPPQRSRREPSPRPAHDGDVDGAGRGMASNARLSFEKRKHAREHCAGRRSVSVPHCLAAAGSPTNGYYERLERARKLREARSCSEEPAPVRSPPSPAPALPPPTRLDLGSRSPQRAAAGSPSPRCGGVCISAKDGSNYPPAPDGIAHYERDAGTFRHFSQAQMRDEKVVAATPIHPIAKPAAPPTPPEIPMSSQQRFSTQKSKHSRTHASSPNASPCPSPCRSPASRSPRGDPSGPPPQYVGIRWTGTPSVRAAGGSPNLAAARLVGAEPALPPQTTA